MISHERDALVWRQLDSIGSDGTRRRRVLLTCPTSPPDQAPRYVNGLAGIGRNHPRNDDVRAASTLGIALVKDSSAANLVICSPVV